VRAVDILLDDRDPGVLHVAGQLELHGRRVHRDAGRQDEEAAVLALPQLMDDGGHQAQHATRALELVQAGPIAIEAIK
jgi:hypothetical protein